MSCITATSSGSSSSSSPAKQAQRSEMQHEDHGFLAFESFCIVCDRAIKPPKEKEPVKPKKKCPAGTIRVKNPDGTVTTRTATGQKTTRPPLRRGPSSNSRLAVACANNAANKMAPLKQATNSAAGCCANGGDEVCLDSPAPSATASQTGSPRTQATKALSPSASAEPPFISSVYCSRACAQVEEARSNDFTRRVSFGHPSPRSLGIVTSGLGFSDSRNKSPYGPPSPLFISGSSDSSSNTDAPQSAGIDAGPACSAPTAMEFFRMTREGPDDAWREVQRQRRSSVHPNSRPSEMVRQLSQASTAALSGEPSSDSLSSMWYPEDGNSYFGRSASGSGKVRVLPLPTTTADRSSFSSASDRSAPVSVSHSRPIPRSSLSQVSLTASSPGNGATELSAEFGSAPQHTLSLWNSYHASFAPRDSISSSASSHKGYAQPVTYSPTMSPPPLGAYERKNSMGSGLSRPLGGTIRAKSKTDVTWDSFGREEVMARSRRASTRAIVEQPSGGIDQTPKQSFETATGTLWAAAQGKYVAPPGISAALNRNTTVRSKSRTSVRSSRSTSDDEAASALAASYTRSAHAGHAMPIPARQPAAVLSVSPVPTHGSSRTPRNSVPKGSSPSPAGLLPDLAALRVGSGGCAPSYLSAEHAVPVPVAVARTAGSAPKSHFNWDEFERQGGKMYDLPKALKVNPNKAGLFFFPTK